jgi:hypothetical protein
MKDINISVKRQKTEILYLIISFALALGLNILGIVIYKTDWKEIYTQARMVLMLGLTIYTILALVRIVVCKTMKLFKKA